MATCDPTAEVMVELRLDASTTTHTAGTGPKASSSEPPVLSSGPCLPHFPRYLSMSLSSTAVFLISHIAHMFHWRVMDTLKTFEQASFSACLNEDQAKI